ncbi:MAG: protein kinase [Planctomycetes bacterium]|nr:protein kinase [Planctomycetota bacterium]
MSDAPGDIGNELANTREMAATYRCVCGNLLPLRSDSGTCMTCGRSYDADVLRDANADTAFLSPDLEEGSGRPPRDEDALKLIGRRLGHFKILDHIGGGGMGAVYRALDESLQRYVALKVIRNVAADANDSEVQQLFQEARAQARVNHPHVAHIYYVGTDDSTPFLAMELVGTHTVAQRLRYGPLSFPDVARFALQITEALDHAAKFDIVHGDIKPSNLLLVDHRNIKITDFGLSRRLSELAQDSSNAAGTPNYMSPEATQGGRTDHRSDMYSLGVTLFEMTFGRLPYSQSSSGHNLPERLRLHREARVEFPDPWPVELPEAWRHVLAKLLEKKPSDRYANFRELIAELKKLQPVTPPAARPLLRGLAWLFDGFIFSAPIIMLQFALTRVDRPLLPLLAALAGGLIPLSASYLQAWWGTTPGKRLFQIRTVDQHGLLPRKSVLAVRAGRLRHAG